MACHPLHLLLLLTVGMVGMTNANAALSPQLYWKSALPKTPMPKSIRDALESKNTKWVVTNPEAKPSAVDIGSDSSKLGMDTKSLTDILNIQYRGRASYKLGMDTKSLSDILNIGYRGRASYKLGMDSKSVSDILNIGYRGRASYKLGTTDTTELQLRVANPHNIDLYFLEQDIKNGKTMNLDLSAPLSTKSAKFLPRHEAEKIPLSSKKLPEILKRFSVKPGSAEAKTIERTVKDLEQPATKGQVDFVATSLEAMIDFINSEIEVEVEAGGVEVEVEAGSTETEVEVEVGGKDLVEVEIPIGLYAVKSGTSKIVSEKSKALVCHKQKYPYAVHYCHGLPKTRAYSVPLEGANGMKVKALALCHTDTSDWNPNHFAFKMLKIKQGTVPVCHFLPQDHIVWYTKN